MISNIPKILIYLFLLFYSPLQAQEIWRESFTLSGKGIWGGENGIIQSDFSGINWSIQFDNVKLVNVDDYAKTVSTSGGRFEVVDITGEVVWLSDIIDISEYVKANIQLSASETGSNTNATLKYLKAFYKIDNGPEILFETNGENKGNWGSAIAEQKALTGAKLQIIVRLANDFASDKVILDEVVVIVEAKPLEPIFLKDVLINEVLFNPVDGGSDFVEIYNHSGKNIAINRLYLASRDTKLELTQVYQLSKSTKIFLEPGKYLALTADTNGVFPFFNIECRQCFLQMEKFPSFNNDEDFVVLLDENLQIIDELHYFDKMHHPLLADVDGIALERTSFAAETNDFKNWHSASTNAGYGTPGYKNSQLEIENAVSPKVTFSPESFSPNFDGYNDEYLIQYELEKPGYVTNISIFDAAGRFVMKLANNEILGTIGTITWNGKDDTGHRLNIGVYVVIVEIFHPSGEIIRFKDGVVLTDVLE